MGSISSTMSAVNTVNTVNKVNTVQHPIASAVGGRRKDSSLGSWNDAEG
jgi:hypothetical protein